MAKAPKESPLRKAPRVRSVRLEKAMIAEAGGLCAWCRRPEALRVHHIDLDPSNTVETNLVALCETCHDLAHEGQPSPSDLHLRKIQLLYERQRAPAALGIAEKTIRIKNVKFSAVNNTGPVQQAETINNKVTYGTAPSGPVVLPGTIATDLSRYNYMEYLIKRLADFRGIGKSYGQKRTGAVHAGVVRAQIQKKHGGLPKDLSLKKWERLVADLKVKIDATIQGKTNKARGWSRYKSFEEFCTLGE